MYFNRLWNIKYRTVVFFVLAILSSILHNVVYGLTTIEEPFFFILTLCFFALGVVSLAIKIWDMIK